MTNAAPQPELSDKYPGAEPLPGYRLVKALGRGGFGEVWLCEAPGRLQKAIKFVPAAGNQGRQELSAFEHMRTIRHPYLLTLERVELVGGDLVMVMELADGQFRDRFRQCRAEGLPGIPRVELLGYLEEAAEALDMLSNEYGLQHLDVKPDNLFLVAGHVKVGDYGLVRSRRSSRDDGQNHGFTPRYTAPEILNGIVDTRSDQYSLALVYTEILTGSFPFSGRSNGELISQHLGTAPNLSMHAPGDRAPLERALSKNPADRFPSCTAFVQALVSVVEGDLPQQYGDDESDSPTKGPLGNARPNLIESCDATVPNRASAAVDRTPSPVVNWTPLPVERRPMSVRLRHADTRRAEPSPPPENLFPSEGIVAVDRLHGMPDQMARQTDLSTNEFVELVVGSLTSDGCLASAPSTQPEDATRCQFMSSVPVSLIPFKLMVVAERWGMSVGQWQSGAMALRWEAPHELSKSAKSAPRHASGFQVIVSQPVPPSVAYIAVGSTFGPPSREVTRRAQENIGPILDQIRKLLQNLDERRIHPRFPTDCPVLVYPQYSDGQPGTPLEGYCRDISLGGVRLETIAPVRTTQVFVEFRGVEPVAGLAICVHVVRTGTNADGTAYVMSGCFSKRC